MCRGQSRGAGEGDSHFLSSFEAGAAPARELGAEPGRAQRLAVRGTREKGTVTSSLLHPADPSTRLRSAARPWIPTG